MTSPSRRRPPQRRRPTSTRVKENGVLAGLCVLAIVGLVAVVASGTGSDPTVTAANAEGAAASASGPAPGDSRGEQQVAATTPATPATTDGATAAPGASGVSVAAVGDTVMGTPEFGLPPASGSTLLDAVKPLLKGEVVFGNLESALATGPSAKCGSGSGGSCYAFASPPSYARSLKNAGFTVMSIANNHSNDWGAAGIRSTVRALDSVGILHAGRPGEIAVQNLPNGTKVAIVGLAPYVWSQNSLDIPSAQRLVRKAAGMAPIVIASFHGGAEGSAYRSVPRGAETYLGEPRGETRRLARGLVEAGADLVIGHGPHVMRGMEFRNGRLIAYSLGNFLGYKVFGTASYTGQSGVLKVKLGPDGRFDSGSLAPVRLSGDGVPSPGGSSVRDVVALSRADFGRSAARLNSSGAITPP
ncbi:MAG: CapA family protein [Actinobacteria bacterium]|nr:CapA family protein [Actinomycetota bacterium]